MQEDHPLLVAVNPLRRKFKQLENIPIAREEFTIGRRSKSSAVIRDYDGISRRHCIIKKVNRTEWEIEVLSTRKIRLNRKKLTKGKVHKLKHNDIIQLDNAGDFVYKFINNVHNEDDYERPCKRRRHNSDAPNNVTNNNQVESNENHQDINQPESSNRQSQPKNAHIQCWMEKDMAKRVQDLVSNFAIQIEKLKGEGSQTRRQRENERNAQLSVVKRQMEDKICAEILGPLKEISKLKDNLLKKQEDFIEKLNSHEFSKHKLQQELKARIQEHAQDKTEKERLSLDLEEVNSQLKSVETEKVALEKINTAAKHATLTELGETMENELQCIICAGMFVGATTLGCSHMFCQFCIGQWKKKKNECPLCRTTIASECKSLVLDLFITKMVENLTDDMKKKREVMLKERTDQEAAALLNPEVDRESEASDGFDINDFILDEEERINEESFNGIISMQFGSDSFDSGNDSEEGHMISDYAREDSHNSDSNSDDSRMMSDFTRENTPDLYGIEQSDHENNGSHDEFDGSQHSNDEHFGSGNENEGDEFDGSQHSNDEYDGSQSSADEHDGSQQSDDVHDGSQHSDDEHDGSQHSDDEHDVSERSDDEYDGSQHSDDENEGSQRSDDEYNSSQHSDGENDGSQRSDDEYDGSQHSDGEHDGSQRSDDEYDGSQHSDDEHNGSQRSDDENDGSQRSDDEHDGSQRSDDEYDGSQHSVDEHDGSQRSDDEHDGSQRSDDEYDGSQRSDDDGSQNSNDVYDGSQHSNDGHDGGNEYNDMEENDEYDNSGRESSGEYSHEEGEQQSYDEYYSSQRSNEQDSDQNSNDDGGQYSNDEQDGYENSNGYENGNYYYSFGRQRYYN